MLLPPHTRTRTAVVDWDLVEDLGKTRDSDIAKRFGVSKTAVSHARRSRGLPSPNPTPKHVIDWEQVPLGRTTDQHVADQLGCSLGLVHKERTKRKIPPHGMNFRTAENEGAYYEEAIIDAWLHTQGVEHQFQVKIGPYRVDWLLSNQEVWEFLGMWDHKIYGEEYRSNFQKKKSFLEDSGYSVREIHRREIPTFKELVDLNGLHSLGNFVCAGCKRSDRKHQAHGLCGTCATKRGRGEELGQIRARLGPSDIFRCALCGSENRYKQVGGNCSKCYAATRRANRV